MDDELRGLITELLERVTDLSLLDLVYKLLLECTDSDQEESEHIQPNI